MNKHFAALTTFIVLCMISLTTNVSALDPSMFGPPMGGFPEPSEEELMMLFKDPMFQQFMLEEEGVDLLKEFPGLAQESKEEAAAATGFVVTASETEADPRTLFLKGLKTGEKGGEKVRLTPGLLRAYDLYLNQLVTQLQIAAKNIGGSFFGIDKSDFLGHLSAIEKLVPKTFAVAHIGSTLEEEIEKNAFLKAFFANKEFEAARKHIVDAGEQLAIINERILKIPKPEEEAYTDIRKYLTKSPQRAVR